MTTTPPTWTAAECEQRAEQHLRTAIATAFANVRTSEAALADVLLRLAAAKRVREAAEPAPLTITDELVDAAARGAVEYAAANVEEEDGLRTYLTWDQYDYEQRETARATMRAGLEAALRAHRG